MRFRLGLRRLATRPSSGRLGRLPQTWRGKGGLSPAVPAPGSPNSPECQSVPDVRNVRPAALEPFGESSGPPDRSSMAFAHHLPPWTHRARERQNLPSLIAYQAILHSKQSGYWLDENFLSVRPAAFRYFYPLPLKEINRIVLSGWFFGRLVVRARNNLSLISRKRGLPGRSNGPHGVCNAC